VNSEETPCSSEFFIELEIFEGSYCKGKLPCLGSPSLLKSRGGIFSLLHGWSSIN
jgi:hypothetical protein